MTQADVPPGTDYKGPSGIARDSNWLTNEDIPHDRDTVVTIESVKLRRNLTMQGGRPKAVALSLTFVGKSRELMLNATNRKTLAALFESNACDAWYGKRIALYVEQDVRRPDGTRGPAVRIRAKRIEQRRDEAGAPEDNPLLTDQPKA
ncbi:MAG: hypothetical protein IPK26_25935 [Planctomycetes bacterium]|nr:hypothetical protein [Planctomycetota bacterium]